MVPAPLTDQAPLSDHRCAVAFFARCVYAMSRTIRQLFGRDPNNLAAHKSYHVLCYCASLIWKGGGGVIDKGCRNHSHFSRRNFVTIMTNELLWEWPSEILNCCLKTYLLTLTGLALSSNLKINALKNYKQQTFHWSNFVPRSSAQGEFMVFFSYV